MNMEISSKDITLRDLSSFLEDCKSLNSLKELIQLHTDSKSSELSIPQLKDALTYKYKLDKAGFALDGFAKIGQSSWIYGGYSKVLEAINNYNSLEAIRADIKKSELDRKNLEDRFGRLNLDQWAKRKGDAHKHRS